MAYCSCSLREYELLCHLHCRGYILYTNSISFDGPVAAGYKHGKETACSVKGQEFAT
jgi:hypothetical protein